MLVVKQEEDWAIDHRQTWHSEALQMLGEKVVVRHRWNIQDFALGRVGRCTECSASPHVNENQRVRTLGASGGSINLIFNEETTIDIPYNQTAEGVKDALEQLDSLETDEIYIIGDALDLNEGLIIEFRGQWAYRDDVPLLEADDTELTGGGSVEIIQTQQGAGGDTTRSLVTETYKQAGSSWCSNCYGVGFEGGFEPIIYVTYALVTDQQAETTHNQSGVIQRTDPQVQFSFAPLVQEFDLCARVYEWEEDGLTPKIVGGRFELDEVRPETLRTGPGTADDSPSFMPPQFNKIYNIPTGNIVIGQTSQFHNLPYEHPLNLVPLTPYEELVVEDGIDRKKTTHVRPVAPLRTNPVIRGID